jgi:hypothetical protein
MDKCFKEFHLTWTIIILYRKDPSILMEVIIPNIQEDKSRVVQGSLLPTWVTRIL